MIILISGKRFAGKDTVAGKLISKDGLTTKGSTLGLTRVSIADTMKLKFMEKYHGINMFNREEKEKHLLELREFTHDKPLSYWINATPYRDNIVVTDIRTIEEIAFIKGKFKNVKVIRLDVSDKVRESRGWIYNKEIDESYLETELDDFDFDLVLQNETVDDIEICASKIQQICDECGDKYFYDLGYGFRFTKELFNGVPFLNIANIFNNVERRDNIIENITAKLTSLDCDFTHVLPQKGDQPLVLAIESGGFSLGAMIAQKLKLPYIIARKPGKLPPPTTNVTYSMEYRPENKMEMQLDAFDGYDNPKVIIVDDIIVTGGTLVGACKLVKMLGGDPVCIATFATLGDEYKKNLDQPVIKYATIKELNINSTDPNNITIQ